MSDDVAELTFEGSPASASFFAHLLREEGLTLDYEQPEETRYETAATMEVATLVLTVTGPLWPAIWDALRKFKAFEIGRGAKISGPPELEMSTEDRLAMLDRLHDEGKITDEEQAQHRARILGEL